MSAQVHRVQRFRSLLVVVGVVLSPSAVIRAQAAGSAAAIDTLIHRSSAAAQIEASANPAAKAKQKEAEEIYERAVAAERAGDTVRAKSLLSDASKTMIEAARLAGRESVVDDKKRADFNKRLESVEALLEAYERVRAEKADKSKGDSIVMQARGKVARSRASLDAGQTDEARTQLDEAYASVKLGIERLREGDTLVRSLNFGSKEEEYRYELDRNDTHSMLVAMLLKDKMRSPGTAQTVQPLIDRAAELRRKAETSAASGQHAIAIALLEESTVQLVRAIRAAGIYVPG